MDFNGSRLRHGIQDQGAWITIDEVESTDFGYYTCTAITSIHSLQHTSEFDIKLEPQSQESNTRELILAFGIVLPIALVIAVGMVAVTIYLIRRHQTSSNQSKSTKLAPGRDELDPPKTTRANDSHEIHTIEDYDYLQATHTEEVYTDVIEIRPAMPSVLSDISDYVMVQVEPSLLTEPDNLQLEPSPIGAGHYAAAYKGILKMKGEVLKVAVKKAKHLETLQEKDDFFKEAAIMRKVCHKNVLPLICIVIKENIPHVVTPFAENGDLKKFISRKDRSFTTLDMLRFGLDIAQGMDCLERNHIVHRDLACRNCLVDGDNRILVTDFGLARDIYQSDVYQARNKRDLPIRWMAIETINPRNQACVFTTKSDVWSYGVTLWEIFTNGGRPYVGILDLWRYLKQGNRLQMPHNVPGEITELMQKCWKENPLQRPNFAEIVETLEGYIQGMEDYGAVTNTSPV